jgi:predicted GNAT family N-acyltransferase
MRCSYSIRLACWQNEASVLRIIRTAVFIDEQKIPEDMEWDEFDGMSIHVLAVSLDEQPIGTARLLPDGHIGRMAVLKEWRRRGIGSAMLRRLLEESKKRHHKEAVVSAQLTAIEFYRKLGFQVSGDKYMEAGIPHIQMIFLF